MALKNGKFELLWWAGFFLVLATRVSCTYDGDKIVIRDFEGAGSPNPKPPKIGSSLEPILEVSTKVSKKPPVTKPPTPKKPRTPPKPPKSPPPSKVPPSRTSPGGSPPSKTPPSSSEEQDATPESDSQEPPTQTDEGSVPPVKTTTDCQPLCEEKCKSKGDKTQCASACATCCEKCKCVPPPGASSANKNNVDKCGKCFSEMNTVKCPA